MSVETRMIKWAVALNRAMDDELRDLSEHERILALTMATAMRIRATHMGNTMEHEALCDTLHEAMLSYPEGGSYAVCEEQLAHRKGE